MATATFDTKPVVCVSVVFNAKKHSTFYDFLSFLDDQGILYANPWATTGIKGKKILRYTYLGFHNPRDVTKIEAWLIKYGGVKSKN